MLRQKNNGKIEKPNFNCGSLNSMGNDVLSFIHDADGQFALKSFVELQNNESKIVETVKISQIRDEDSLKIRSFADEEIILTLVNVIRSKRELKPIVLASDGLGKYYVIDGETRLLAHRRTYREQINAVVLTCTLRQALILRLLMNNHHSQRLKGSEKRDAALKLLKDKSFANRSDREIAHYVGASDRMVAGVRKELNPSSNGSRIVAVVRGGKQYEMKISRKSGKADFTKSAKDVDIVSDNSIIKKGKRENLNCEHDEELIQELLLADKEEKEERTDETLHNAERINSEYSVKSGEIFVLYDPQNKKLFQIIFCGDALDANFYKIAFADMKAGLLIADPPWGVNRTAGGHRNDAIAHRLDKIQNDNLPQDKYQIFIQNLFATCSPHILRGSVFFVYRALKQSVTVYKALEEALGDVRQEIIWVKRGIRQGGSRFKNNHETAFFGIKDSATQRFWDGGKSQSTVFDENLLEKSRYELPRQIHPTPKPVTVTRRMIEICLEPNGVVLDPVAGSGTTLVAAHISGRSGVGVEIEPAFVAVAVDRLVKNCCLKFERTRLEGLPEVLRRLGITRAETTAVSKMEGRKMFDTVMFRRKAIEPLSFKVLTKFRRHEVKPGLIRWFHHNNDRSYSPTIHYTLAPDGKCYISVEVSLPKLVFDGNNVEVITDMRQIEDAAERISDLTVSLGLGNFDVLDADVARIDYCTNFLLDGTSLIAYQKAISKSKPPYLKRKIYGDMETIEFSNKTRKIYFYDKKLETESLLRKKKSTPSIVKSAEGILRFEVRFSKPSSVKKVSASLNLPDTKARTLLNFTVARKILNDALSSMQLNNSITNIDGRFRRLHDKYDYTPKYQKLVGFLTLCDLFGMNNLIRLGIIKQASFHNQLKEVKAANALLFTEGENDLFELKV